MAIVYEHIRKDNNQVFYIGIGKTIARAKSKLYRNEWWHRIVNKVDYVINIKYDGITWDEACILETMLIKHYGRRDLGLGELVNLTNGGEGFIGGIFTKEHKEKIAEAQRKHWLTKENRLHTEETKKKMSKTRKGKKMPKSVGEKISKIQTGRKHTTERCNNMSKSQSHRKKPILVHELNGDFIGEFKSIPDFVREKLSHINKRTAMSNVYNVCNGLGHSKSYYGMTYSYK